MLMMIADKCAICSGMLYTLVWASYYEDIDFYDDDSDCDGDDYDDDGDGDRGYDNGDDDGTPCTLWLLQWYTQSPSPSTINLNMVRAMVVLTMMKHIWRVTMIHI